MKKVMYASLAFVLAAFMLASCSKNTPKDVAYNWLTAFNHLDFETAKKLSTADTKTCLHHYSRSPIMLPTRTRKNLKK